MRTEPERRPCPVHGSHFFRKSAGVWVCEYCGQNRNKNGKVIKNGQRGKGV